jgi:hypothetical protein
MRRMLGALLFVVYIIIGVVVAAGHHYFEHLDALKPIVSAVLAVVLWPLVVSARPHRFSPARSSTGRVAR